MAEAIPGTVQVRNPFNGEDCYINETIADFIRDIWALNIETTNEDGDHKEHSGFMWVQMNSRNYCRLMSILADYNDPCATKLYHKILDGHDIKVRFNACDENMHVLDWWDDFKDDPNRPRAEIEINCNVYISYKIFPEVCEKIRHKLDLLGNQ
jgi:hypothetical protein